MRLLHLFIILVVLAVVVLGGLAFFDMAPVPALNEMAWKMKGWGPAKTPDEALEKYKKAMDARNYTAASRYLDGDYQIQFRKIIKPAQRLAEATDNFRHAGNDRGYIDDPKVDAILISLEPFPKTINYKVKESASGDTAVAELTMEKNSKQAAPMHATVPMKKKDDAWRIEFPLTDSDRAHFEMLEKYGQQYTNALDVVKNRMKTDATTKGNVFQDLDSEVKQVGKP
jgi:hypothetical protein